MDTERFICARDLLDASRLLRDISASGEMYYITKNEQAKAVLMDINRYNALMDIIEETESFRDGAIPHNFSVRGILREASQK